MKAAEFWLRRVSTAFVKRGCAADHAEIAPRSCRDHAEIAPRPCRDHAERSLRDHAEITSRDHAEIALSRCAASLVEVLAAPASQAMLFIYLFIH